MGYVYCTKKDEWIIHITVFRQVLYLSFISLSRCQWTYFIKYTCSHFGKSLSVTDRVKPANLFFRFLSSVRVSRKQGRCGGLEVFIMWHSGLNHISRQIENKQETWSLRLFEVWILNFWKNTCLIVNRCYDYLYSY